MEELMYYFGLDIGSISTKLAVVDSEKNIIEEHYVRHFGQPIRVALDLLKDALSRHPEPGGLGVTGVAGKLVARLLNCHYVNEVIAHALGTATLYPDTRSIIEVGGENSKLILITNEDGEPRVLDFSTNTVCAAGTGSFLDQQAVRLGIDIEEEFGELALKSESPPRVAGRCSVFAKSDMIHLQQEATPLHDIIAGLCHAMARNFESTVAKGKKLLSPVAFQGGVAANRGMVKAFREELGFGPEAIFIPEHFATMGAIGAVFDLMRQRPSGLGGLQPLEEYLLQRALNVEALPKLEDDRYPIDVSPVPLPDTEGKIEAYVGVDVGSISTNVVVIDKNKRVLARRYLMTAGRPLEAVKKGLKEVGDEIGNRVIVKGACTTGSGRYLTGAYIGADIVKNEITSHARGAVEMLPNVDTVFEIGGQDAKYISISNGAVVDFTMNKACAAGTGSFLEEQAERLGLRIEEFGSVALSSSRPINLGERCTVFMESSLNHYLQRGAPKEDLVAGLCYSIVYNYLNRVVEDRKVGDVILFQGGTAFNRGVKSAFEKVLGKKVIVPPHHDVLGAIGAGIIAMENSTGSSSFKGFDLSERNYSIETFECEDCPNRCEIRKVTFTGESPLLYGSRCGKYDEEGKRARREKLPQPFRERERILMGAYEVNEPIKPNGKSVAIPRVGVFYELYPFFKAFFIELGFSVVPSAPTTQVIVQEGLEHCVAEHCFPIKVAYGHILNALQKEPDYIFLPSVVDMPPLCEGMERSYNCPYVQVIPDLAKSVLSFDKTQLLAPILHLRRGEPEIRRAFTVLARELGFSEQRAHRAIDIALKSQQRFYTTIRRRGEELLDSLSEGSVGMVLVGRPYNTCDFGINLRIPQKLAEMDVVPIPIDFLPLHKIDLSRDYPHMYWKYGQKIVASAKIIAEDERLDAVYITNFGCGPDSFIMKYFAREMRGKPFLSLEVDEHSSDVGLITRCEAFLDSVKARRGQKVELTLLERNTSNILTRRDRKVYIPYMDDHGYVLASAMRAHGIDAEYLGMSDEESVALGRTCTSGKECFPCIVTSGDLLKLIKRKDFDPERSAFFMPTAMGPCRFGQYNRFHRMLLDELGLEHFPIVTLDQASTDGFMRDTSNLGTEFRKLAWGGFVLVDLLQKLTRQTRPYELEPGACDKLYEKFLQRIEETTENRGDFLALAHEIRDAFLAVPVDRSEPKPRIGIVGEIYVRCNQFCNNFLMRKLEALGAEVSLPPLQEWIDYIAFERKVDAVSNGRYGDWLKEIATQLVQERIIKRLTKPFEGVIRDFLYEEPTKEIIRRARPYLDFSFRGEAILSMGRLEEYAEHRFAGVVNVIPFNCLPGTIVEVLMEHFRRRHPDIPILKMSYDGFFNSAEETRLEAFVYQCKARLRTLQPA